MTRFGQTIRKSVTTGVVALLLATTAQAETLGQALASAYTHSGLLEQNRALLRAADEDVAVAMSALRPIVNWSAKVERSFGTTRSSSTGGMVAGFVNNTATFGISAELLLYDFGRSRMGVEAAKESVLATREGLIAIEQNVLLQAVSVFMEVRRALETAALAESNVRVITEELRAANDRFEVGEITRTDVSSAEARLAAARANFAAATGALEVARAEYAAAIGHRPNGLVPPSRLPAMPTESNAMAIALRSHPNMSATQHQVAAAELGILRAEAVMKPSVKLGASLGLSDDLDSSNYTNSGSVSLGVSGPIYQGGQLSALRRKAIASRDAALGNLHVVRHGIRRDVENAYARLKIAQASLNASERQVRAARVAFRGIREEATLGARTTLDVLNAEQELLDAQAAQISAAVDETVAAYAVLSSAGLLTAKHLNLNVQHYDPVEYYNLVKNAPVTKSRQGRKLDQVLKSLGKN